MPFKSLHLAVVVVGLTLQPQQLLSQVPIQVGEADDSYTSAFVRALKAALLNSPSFRVLDGGQTRRLWVQVATGGSVKCSAGDAVAPGVAMGVAIVIGVTPRRASDISQILRAAVFDVGSEEEAVRLLLPDFHDAAVKLGVPAQSR